jgi:hypothetical protein
MDSEEQTQFWRVVVRVSLIVGIVAALITIFGVLHSFSSPGQSAASNSTSTSQATSTLAADGPTATATIVPTSTPRPKPGDILYQANWSSGLNGWAGTSDWQTLNGKLLNNGQADQPSTILAPFNSGGNGVSDYAVQASIQLIRTTIAQWNAFGIVVR